VFVLQTNENMEITSALQSEQHVKKELAKKLGQLQENLGELKDTVSDSRWDRRAGTERLVQTAGSFPSFDGRMEIAIVMIKLGAFPHRLLSDVRDQHVGADGGCLPSWWLWGNVDSLDHVTGISFSGRNGLMWWFGLVTSAGTENTGGSGAAGAAGPVLQPLTTVRSGVPAAVCREGGTAQAILASDTADGSAAARGGSGEGDSGNAPERAAADQGNSKKGQVERWEEKCLTTLSIN